MAVVWTDTPLIKKITLPSGNTYFIADREGREKIEQLFETISGGVSFVISWDGASTPVVANIPEGVKVTYQGTTYTGTLDPDDAQPGAFYLVKSSTQTSEGVLDVYDEYVPAGSSGSKTWEKIGDTQLDLSDVVTNVVLSKQTTNVVTGYSNTTNDKVLGEATTFALTSGSVTFGTPTTDTFVKSVSAETNKNLVTTSIAGVSGSTSVTGVQSSTTTASKASASAASKATAATSQTTADGTVTDSTTNTDILKGATVSNEVLSIGAATLDTQTTTQFTFSDVTFSDVTVPIKAASATTVPIAASATTVATGATSTTGTGDAVVTGVTIGSSASAITALPTASVSTGITVGTNDKVTALTGLGSPSTASVLNNTTDITVTKGK